MFDKGFCLHFSMIKLEDSKVDRPSQGFFSRYKKLLFAVSALLIIEGYSLFYGVSHGGIPTMGTVEGPRCGKIEPLAPSFNKSIDLILHDPTFKKESIERFAGAVRIPTEMEDVHPAPADKPEYYSRFFELHEYLAKNYPLTHEHLQLEKVNEVGLLYTWEGSNKDLKPLILMAHQDVVPVNKRTWGDWEHPPFSGHYDKETDNLWGRGTSDCKNLLTAELEAIELLLKDGYTAERTTIISLGFDEESGGSEGAQHLARFLEERYGHDGAYAIVDEGNGVFAIDDSVFVAAPINAEKGYLDLIYTINGHGGHSSVPPDHTTIGVAAQLISKLEDHPFKPTFSVDNPLYGFLTCAAEHSKKISPALKKDILEAAKSPKSREQLTKFLASEKSYRDLVRTTRAVDIINGGIKANALPEVTSFLINHRIDIHSSVNKTLQGDLKYAKKIAKKYGYGLSYNGEYLVPETELGIIEVSSSNSLEPAPISPSSGPIWDTFVGTIQNVFENGVFAGERDVEFYISTGLFTGNTDTKYYWNLTKNINRFIASIGDETVMKTIHSVNEHIKADSHLSAIAFVYQYIVNAGNAH